MLSYRFHALGQHVAAQGVFGGTRPHAPGRVPA